ncbi:MAG TPA: hypothetical protein VNP93_05240 [Gaiellaceae bacterium]|nr:hypothetical protein [Gaiellaceae bacterium]
MRRLLTWLAGGLGVAALLRQLLRRQPLPPPAPPPATEPSTADPAEELRAKLEQARDTADDRDEFDAAEGTPIDTVEALPAEPPNSLEERRRRVHDKAQEALGQMRGADDD